MKYVFGISVMAAAVAAVILFQLERSAELIAWEILIILVILGLFRVLPANLEPPGRPLFRVEDRVTVRPPRAVASYEMAAVHAFSEAPGSDRRIRAALRRIAQHRQRLSGFDPKPPEGLPLALKALERDAMVSLKRDELRRIVEELENV